MYNNRIRNLFGTLIPAALVVLAVAFVATAELWERWAIMLVLGLAMISTFYAGILALKTTGPRYPLFWALAYEAKLDDDDVFSLVGWFNSREFRQLPLARRRREIQRLLPQIHLVGDQLGFDVGNNVPPRLYRGWMDDRQEVAIFLQSLRDPDQDKNPLGEDPKVVERSYPRWKQQLLRCATMLLVEEHALLDGVTVAAELNFEHFSFDPPDDTSEEESAGTSFELSRGLQYGEYHLQNHPTKGRLYQMALTYRTHRSWPAVVREFPNEARHVSTDDISPKVGCQACFREFELRVNDPPIMATNWHPTDARLRTIGLKTSEGHSFVQVVTTEEEEHLGLQDTRKCVSCWRSLDHYLANPDQARNVFDEIDLTQGNPRPGFTAGRKPPRPVDPRRNTADEIVVGRDRSPEDHLTPGESTLVAFSLGNNTWKVFEANMPRHAQHLGINHVVCRECWLAVHKAGKESGVTFLEPNLPFAEEYQQQG